MVEVNKHVYSSERQDSSLLKISKSSLLQLIVLLSFIYSRSFANLVNLMMKMTMTIASKRMQDSRRIAATVIRHGKRCSMLSSAVMVSRHCE